MTKVAVIGSNGFIGRHLVQKLSEIPQTELHLFGRSSESSFGNKFSYKQIDFSNSAALKKDFAGIDVVYYLASETIPATSWNNPVMEVEKNLLPFLNFLEISCELKVKKVAFVSSAGTIYGATDGKVSEDSNKKPFSPYGIMKLTMENFLHHYHTKCGLQYDVYRVSNVYGEGQNTGKGLGIINTFLEKIIRDNKVQVFGDGKSTRNYIYVKDVAELLSLSVKNINHSDIYNVSSNSTLSINDLLEVMKKSVEENFEVLYQESRQSDNSYIDLDNSKILKNFTGFSFTSINEGVAKTYKALKTEKIKHS